MGKLFSGGTVFRQGDFAVSHLLVEHGRIVSVDNHIQIDDAFNCDNLFILPGFADLHVHLREPGFSHKETIASGTKAAAAGGYTLVCSMPNLNPTPDTPENLKVQQDIIDKDGILPVLPYGCITMGEGGQELCDLKALAPYVCGFSDDGKGVQSDEMMERAMTVAASLKKPIMAHCEDERLLFGGYIHDGEYAKAHGHRGISSESEYRQIERDLKLVRKTGCQYHVCHISTKESVELIRGAKAEGLPVTCETAPHYLFFCDVDLKDEGRFKMNPPLRTSADREALIAAVADGTIDCIATDHAPHSIEEKSKGLKGSAMGIVGLETAFAVLYTALVKTGKITLDILVERMAIAPRRILGLEIPTLDNESAADFSVWDLNTQYEIDPQTFESKGRATPFSGMKVFGRNVMTIKAGRIIWKATQQN